MSAARPAETAISRISIWQTTFPKYYYYSWRTPYPHTTTTTPIPESGRPAARRITTRRTVTVYVIFIYGALAADSDDPFQWPCIYYAAALVYIIFSVLLFPVKAGRPSRRTRPTLTPQPSYACAATGQKHSPSFSSGDWSHPRRRRRLSSSRRAQTSTAAAEFTDVEYAHTHHARYHTSLLARAFLGYVIVRS